MINIKIGKGKFLCLNNDNVHMLVTGNEKTKVCSLGLSVMEDFIKDKLNKKLNLSSPLSFGDQLFYANDLMSFDTLIDMLGKILEGMLNKLRQEDYVVKPTLIILNNVFSKFNGKQNNKLSDILGNICRISRVLDYHVLICDTDENWNFRKDLLSMFAYRGHLEKYNYLVPIENSKINSLLSVTLYDREFKTYPLEL